MNQTPNSQETKVSDFFPIPAISTIRSLIKIRNPIIQNPTRIILFSKQPVRSGSKASGLNIVIS